MMILLFLNLSAQLVHAFSFLGAHHAPSDEKPPI
jgi:hypothetical protein